MRSLNIRFTDDEFKALETVKKQHKHSWHEFILYLIYYKEGDHNVNNKK